jgi:hypothetical protein
MSTHSDPAQAAAEKALHKLRQLCVHDIRVHLCSDCAIGVIASALRIAVAERTEACAKIADEQERLERGFGVLAHQSGDTWRESDFYEGAVIAKTIASSIRALAHDANGGEKL